MVEAGENSPCALEMAGFWCFWACWESFVPVGPGGGRAGRVLYRLGQGAAVAGRVFYRVSGGLVVEPGKSSPCSVSWWLNREKVLPARLKWPDFGVFGRAGRVLYRLGQGTAVAGRVLYRVSGGLVLEAGENSPCSREMAGFRCFWACWESFVPGEWWIGGGTGRKFSLLARNGRISLIVGVRGEFCTGWALRRACRESFVPGEWWVGVGSGRKFSLLGGVVVEPGENSPCSREMAGFR